MNDVRIYGMNMHTVFIEDISMDVPHGVTVVVPADKAARSKDLWRLLSQRQIFRLDPSGPFSSLPPVSPPTPSAVEAEKLREEVRALTERNQMLEKALNNQGGKLDAILGLLERQKGAPVTEAHASPVGKTPSDVVEVEAPTYIPSRIKPDNVESHVEVQSDTTSDSNVTKAGEALRRYRKGAR